LFGQDKPAQRSQLPLHFSQAIVSGIVAIISRGRQSVVGNGHRVRNGNAGQQHW
jgi:hypothetical protein